MKNPRETLNELFPQFLHKAASTAQFSRSSSAADEDIFNIKVKLESDPKQESWDFEYGYRHVTQDNAKDYLFETSDVKICSEWHDPPVTYWGPSADDVGGTITYKFEFEKPTEAIHVKANINSFNFPQPWHRGVGKGDTSLWGSIDNIEWVELLYNPLPLRADSYMTYDDLLPESLVGEKIIYIQVRMKVWESVLSALEEGHLGGCAIEGDVATHYPIMWSYLIDFFKIKSVIDVGCGFGYSLDFFQNLGCDIVGVEGSDKVIAASPLKDKMVHVDYTTTRYVPAEEYDLCWSCEFVEHVHPSFCDNYIATFKKAKFLALTFAGVGQGGHHHVNENTQPYWINLLESHGFKYDADVTKNLQLKAKEDFLDARHPADNSKAEWWTYPHHFIQRGLFFENKS